MDPIIINPSESANYIVLAWRENEDSPIALQPQVVEHLKIKGADSFARTRAVTAFLNQPDKQKTFDLLWVRVNEKNPRHYLVIRKENVPVIYGALQKASILQIPVDVFNTEIEKPKEPDKPKEPAKPKDAFKGLNIDWTHPDIRIIDDQFAFGEITAKEHERLIRGLTRK